MNLPIPAIILPYSTRSTTVLTANNGITTINSSGNFESINVDATLLFDLRHGDLSIQTETLNLGPHGRIETIGSRRLFLYVTMGNHDKGATLKLNQGNINPPLDGVNRANHLVMFVAGTITVIDISGRFNFSGGLYAPNANLSASGRAASINGSIIANAASVEGSVTISYEVITAVGLPHGFSTGSLTPPSPENMFQVISWNEL